MYDADAAVIIGSIGFFNHVDDKWVVQFTNAKLHFEQNQQRDASGLKIVLLQASPPATQVTNSAFEGPPGTSPYILTPWDAVLRPPQHRGFGYFTKTACKKRKYRIDCVDVLLALEDPDQKCLYRVKRLYLEGTFHPTLSDLRSEI